MQRREFVQKSLGVVSLLAIGGCGRAAQPRQAEPEPDMKAEPRIGVQLYTVRTLLENDFEGTINEIARIGYREVELHSLFGRTSHEVRGILDGAGLAAPAWHVGADDLRSNMEVIVEEAICLGCSWVVCPYIDASERTLEGYRKVADELNTAGRACSDAGIYFAYHNHDFEFAERAGRVPFDVLLESTDPSLVAIELDLYWISKAGHDPLAYLARGAGTDRYKMVHVKDMDATPARGMVDPGTGVLDFSRLLPAARAAGVEHYFVEHDHPGDPLATARTGYRYLQRLLR